jgi:hypothetical protein
MRIFIVLLLLLSVAFQSIAATHVFEPPCPMEADMHSGMMADTGTPGDCCNDADTAAKTGKLCKNAQNCSPSQVFTLASFTALVDVPFSALPAPMANDFAPPPTPGDIWRPPAYN